MTPTTEQQNIIDYVKEHEGLVLVNSVAGSGKTTLLTNIAKELKPKNGLYLAYTKIVASSAQKKFPKGVKCLTTHSLAYGPTVRSSGKNFKLKLGKFSARSVIGVSNYERRQLVATLIREFCLSKHIDFNEFIKEATDITPAIIRACHRTLVAMQKGEIECSHDFYLKLYHMLLAQGTLEYQPFDLIMLDEAGDLNEVTLEIFNLLPAKRKIMVGDPKQNIFGFNHTINCFEVMKGKGPVFPMSTSFRTSEKIAKRIEKFCNKYIDPKMKFKGVPVKDTEINTRAFISRTNGALISKMIELNHMAIPYGLTRHPEQIFKGPLALCNLKPHSMIADPDLKYLQEDVNEYYEDELLKSAYKTPLHYIRDIYRDDIEIQQSINLIFRYGISSIMTCYKVAREHYKKEQTYILGTAHSTKGMEYDEVTIGEDLNQSITKILEKTEKCEPGAFSENALAEFNLYYVACSRAKKVLLNALYV